MNDLSLFYRWGVCDREKLCHTTPGLQACSLHPPLIGWEGVRAGNFRYPWVYQRSIWAWRWRVTCSVSWGEELDEEPGYWPSVCGAELLLPAPSPWTWALSGYSELIHTSCLMTHHWWLGASVEAVMGPEGAPGIFWDGGSILRQSVAVVSWCTHHPTHPAVPSRWILSNELKLHLSEGHKRVPVCVFGSCLSQSGPPSVGCMKRVTHNVRSPLPPLRGPLPCHQLWSLQALPVLGLTFPIYNIGTKHLLNRVFRGINGYHPM